MKKEGGNGHVERVYVTETNIKGIEWSHREVLPVRIEKREIGNVTRLLVISGRYPADKKYFCYRKKGIFQTILLHINYIIGEGNLITI